jgi:hypothetical protein
MGAAVSIVCSILYPSLASAEWLRPQARAHAHVYLLRSFMNVFSSPIYELAAKVRIQGIYATVHHYFEWPFLAEQAVRHYREGWEDPIIIVGHSLGADAAISMADRLAQAGVPAKLVVTLDPVAGSITDGSRDRVVKLYIFNEVGVPVARGQSVGDQLLELELRSRTRVWHAFMDESLPTLDQLILGYVLEAAAGGPARAPVKDDATAPAKHQRTGNSVSRSSAEYRSHHLAGGRSGLHRGSPSVRVSGRIHRRLAAPVVDTRSSERHRSPARGTHGAGKPSTHAEAKSQRGGLSPDERKALFQRFLEWRRNQSPNP